MRLPRPQWTPAEDAALEAGLAAGRMPAEIGVELGRSVVGVRGRWRRIQSGRRYRPWTPERQEQLISLMESHKSWKQIGRIMGNAPKYLQHRAVAAGISLRRANG